MNSPIRTSWIDLAPGFAGYLALPPSGYGPGLVLWQEIFGVNEHIQAVAHQYALAGFVVLAPDVFWRQAPRVELGYDGSNRERAVQLMQACQANEALADIGLAVQAIRAQPQVTGRVGSIGYCMGGRMAYLTAATTTVDAAVAYYGGGIQNLLDRADAIGCPLQLHYAERDAHIPLAAVEQVRQRLLNRAGGAPTEVHVYAGADHGFNCWARASYHPASAALALGRTVGFLAQHLFVV